MMGHAVGRDRIRRPARRRRALALAALVLAPGCRVALDEEHLGEPGGLAGAEARTLCVLQPPTNITRSGAFSLDFPDGAYWIFGETIVDLGGGSFAFLSNSGAVGSAPFDPCAEGLTDVVDETGAPAQLIRLTDEERAADEVRADGTRTVLWPLSGFVHDGTGMIYYRKIRLRDYFDFAVLGVGVARIELGGLAERLAPARWVDEPTLLWLSPQADWGTGAFVAEDGMAYVYGCYQRAAWDWPCRVARVAPDNAGDPTAYEYRTDDDWTSDVQFATEVAAGETYLSVAYNRHLGRTLAVYAGPLGNDVYAMVADDPWGPFDDPVKWFTGIAPTAFWIGDVHQHPYYAADDDAKLLVGYYTSPASPADGPPGLRLVEVVLP
jgi:hypothetical protein